MRESDGNWSRILLRFACPQITLPKRGSRHLFELLETRSPTCETDNMEYDQPKFDILSPDAKSLFKKIGDDQKIIRKTRDDLAMIVGSNQTIAWEDAKPLIKELVAGGVLFRATPKQWQIPYGFPKQI